MATTGVLLDDIFIHHETETGHPERPERIAAVREGLSPLKGLVPLTPRRATFDEVALCHDPRYVEGVLRQIKEGETELAGGDVSVGPESGEVALLAVGGVIDTVDQVLDGKLDRAFCAVRPPGHHARPAAPMGFCLFNNVAIAARYAQKHRGLRRVAIVDWDVHHGNGTQEIFYQDGSVLFFSLHQWPWYPGSGRASERGAGDGEGRIINRPLASGAGGREALEAVTTGWLPAVEEFRPELILISAGFDSRAGDPLGQLRLTDDDFAALTNLVLDAASRHCSGRVVSVLEGGYSLTGLAAGVRSHVKALAESA